MTEHESSPDATADYAIRLARPSDAPTVLAFCAQTWDFGDYIDQVWDAWLADPATDLLVLVDAADRPIGLGQVRRVTPTEAWLEGLRVDPAIRRRGLARALAEAAGRLARDRGAQVVRFATLATNEPIHRLAPQIGFARVGAFLFGEAPAESGPGPRFEPWTGDPTPTIAFIERSATIATAGGLIAAGWHYARPSADLLNRWQAETPGRLYRLRPAGRTLAYAWIEPPAAAGPLTVPWLAANRDDLIIAGLALRRLAHEMGSPAVVWRVPSLTSIGAAAGAAGFEPRDEPGYWLYAAQLTVPTE